VHGELRVEQVGEAEPVGLGRQLEQLAVRIERPGAPLFEDTQPSFLGAEEEAFPRLAGGFIAEGDRYRVGTVPAHLDNDHGAVAANSFHARTDLQFLERCHL